MARALDEEVSFDGGRDAFDSWHGLTEECGIRRRETFSYGGSLLKSGFTDCSKVADKNVSDAEHRDFAQCGFFSTFSYACHGNDGGDTKNDAQHCKK